MKKVTLILALIFLFIFATIILAGEIIEPRAGYWATKEIDGPSGDTASWLHQRIMKYENERNFRMIRKHVDTGMVIMFYGTKVRVIKRKGNIVLVHWIDRKGEAPYWWISADALKKY